MQIRAASRTGLGILLTCLVATMSFAQESTPQALVQRLDLKLTNSLFDEFCHDAVWKDLGIERDSDLGKEVARLLENIGAETAEVSLSSSLSRGEAPGARGNYLLIKRDVELRFLPELKKTLGADQFARLQQIHWQRIGRYALIDPEVATALEMKPDQLQRLTAAQEEYLKATAPPVATRDSTLNTLREMGRQSREQREAADKAWTDKINQTLTEDQRDRFAKLKGKNFDFSSRANGSEFTTRTYLTNLPNMALLPEVLVELGIDKDDRKAKAIRDVMYTASDESNQMRMLQSHEPNAGTAGNTYRINSRVAADLKRILTDEQFKRLRQIYLQHAGIRVMFDPEVIQELQITADQSRKLSSSSGRISREANDTSTLDPNTPILKSQVIRDRYAEQKRREAELIKEILTPEQQAKLTEMKGKLIEVTFPRLPPAK